MFELLLILIPLVLIAALSKSPRLNVYRPEECVVIDNKWIPCDGKKCGLGKYVRGGHNICPHYNLKVKYPNLAIEWHQKNLKGPEEYLPHSGQIVWWKCCKAKCECHEWSAEINSRTKGFGCPFCNPINPIPCIHYNFKVYFPELTIQWHPKNPEGPENYTPYSHTEVWWKCDKDPCGCHEWPAIINSRAQGNGCPFCNSTCPIPCIHYNLKVYFPDLVIQWHPKNPKGPENYTPHSEQIVWWKCDKAKCECHEWPAVIKSRTKENGTGCPFCSHTNTRPCIHNNFKIYCDPKLIIEWDPSNPDRPEDYALHSHKKVRWICKENSYHKWNSVISARVYRSGCPHCFAIRKGLGYSKASIEWMQLIEVKENIKIQYIEPEKGIPEYKVEGVGKVDGYCKENNTIYEFHGDFWHGNPNMFNLEDFNRVNGKKFGDLYKKTIERDNKIRSLGYNLVVKWETDLE